MPIDAKLVDHVYNVMRLNIQDTAKILGVHPATVSRCIVRNGIRKRNTQGRRLNPCVLTACQKEVVIGALLGDGGVVAGNRESAHLTYASKSEQHATYVANYLRSVACPAHKEKLSITTQYDNRTDKSYTRHCFRSVCDTTFRAVHRLWYPCGVKMIPRDTKLSPLSCLIWYLGDGGLNKQTGNITLATNCFAREEIEEILLPQLSQFVACIYKRNGEGQFAVRIPRRNVPMFLAHIGPCPFNDYVHKWRHKEYVYKRYERYNQTRSNPLRTIC